MPTRVRRVLRLPLLALAAALWSCGSGAVATLEFVELVPALPKLGEVTTVRFRVIDYRGQPQAGVSVDFKLQGEGNTGVILTPLNATSEKGTGTVDTQLVASSHVTSVIVVATAGNPAAGGKTATSPSISFAGGVANGKQLTFQCGPLAGEASGGVHAIGAYDEDRYLIAGVKLECTAHVGDRSGDGVPGALVSFLTEAGTIGPSETSIADVVGNAKILHKTSYPLPLETTPGTFSWSVVADKTHTGDYLVPLWMEPFRWTDNPVKDFGTANLREPRRTDPLRKRAAGELNNPRDNLVAMIAVTSGEEGFIDNNNNGRFDKDKDTFDGDLTEPFVDSDDDGTWDPGEKFIDTNNNGQWDGKNEQWDSNTLIWTQERILWTGLPSGLDSTGTDPILRVVSPVGPIFVPYLSFYGMPDPDPMYPGNRIPLPAQFLLSDPWFNSIAQDSDSDGCEIGSDDDMSPVKAVPKRLNEGFRVTYPPYELINFYIRDARDPNAPPISQIPKRIPPIDFGVPLLCHFTSSPISGARTTVSIGTIRGKVE